MEEFLLYVLVLLGAVNMASCEVQERIVGGKPVNIGDYPFQVSVWYQNFPACGGTIISNLWILTACHCFPKEHSWSDYHIVLGTTNLDPPDPTVQTVLINSVVMYPGYSADAYGGDVALVKLNTALTFGPGVAAISLLAANVQIPAGLACSVTGWGSIRPQVPLDNPKPLQMGFVHVISKNTCQCLHNINPNSESITTIQSDMICATGPDGPVDACQGDSGGPLSSFINGKSYLIGVVSWGESCGDPDKPGVYIVANAYVDWIQRYVADCQVESIVIDQQPTQDDPAGCKTSDGKYHSYNGGAVLLVTFISLPLYWLTAYLLTNL